MSTGNGTTKAAWIEPVVLSLDLTETQIYPNRGSDRATHLDCTKS